MPLKDRTGGGYANKQGEETVPVNQSALRSALLVHRSLFLEGRQRCRDFFGFHELGRVSAIDSNGRTIWIADACQGDEKRCLKKEHERLPQSACALLYENGTYPHPRAAHAPSR